VTSNKPSWRGEGRKPERDAKGVTERSSQKEEFNTVCCEWTKCEKVTLLE